MLPAILALSKKTSTKMVTFMMCAFRAEWQKATTLMYTAGFDAWLDILREYRCVHKSHPKIAGGDKTHNKWNSNETAAYPPDFNMFVAQAIANFVRQRQSLSVAPADVPTPSTSTMSHEPTAPTPSAAITPTVPSTSFFGNVDDKLNTLSTTAINATSIRKLSFDGIDGILH